MSRLDDRFAETRAAGRAALVTFVTAGDPQPFVTVPLLHALVEAGADVLELGVPFSDPMADGPVIQRASERALKHHVNLRGVLAMVAEFRKKDARTPVVLMGYLNPIEAMGYAPFAAAARGAGVDGVLTVDLPPEEAAEFVNIMKGNEIAPIFLLAPTTDDARARRICGLAAGFVYYVSLKGVTGAGSLDTTAVGERVTALRKLTPLPIGVGFGVRDPQSAAALAAHADAVIVGSALVSRVEELVATPERIAGGVAEQVRAMRKAMDRTVRSGR